MSASDEVQQQWRQVVQDDLDAVLNQLEGPKPNLRVACYHLQQAAEKLVKAYLVAFKQQPPRLHNIASLLALLPVTDALPPDLSELQTLTVFQLAYRYPDTGEIEVPPQLTDAQIRQRHQQITRLLAELVRFQ